MTYLLSLAANILSVGSLVLGVLIAEGAIAVGAGVTVAALGLKINKRKKEIAQRESTRIGDLADESEIEPEQNEPDTKADDSEQITLQPEEVYFTEKQPEPAPQPIEMEAYQPVAEPEDFRNKDFNKYSETHDSDVAELRRHLEEMRRGMGFEPPVFTRDTQSWEQIKDYNAAVMPITSFASETEETGGDDQTAKDEK